jgi:hypothetical protein
MVTASTRRAVVVDAARSLTGDRFVEESVLDGSA